MSVVRRVAQRVVAAQYHEVARPLAASARRRVTLMSVGLGTSVWAMSRGGLTECEPRSAVPRLMESVNEEGPALHRNFVSRAAAMALPAVVNITVTISQQTIFGVQQGMSAGSGFIVRDDGLVVTNAHVVSSGQSMHVTLNDGRRYPAHLVAMDRNSDVALIQMNNAKNLPVAEIGSSSRVRSGDFVVALGSPLNLSNSVTFGIVSNVARHGSEIGMMQQRAEFLQVDCAINQGNSGGPLVDLDGKVVGINTMKAQAADGIGFALPIDSAWQVVRQLLKHGKVARPFIGFKMVVVVDNHGVFGPRGDRKVVVAQVVPGSPADKAGVQAGDVVHTFDGQPVSGVPDILAHIGLEIPQDIPVTILRPTDDPRNKPPDRIKLVITTTSHDPGLPA